MKQEITQDGKINSGQQEQSRMHHNPRLEILLHNYNEKFNIALAPKQI